MIDVFVDSVGDGNIRDAFKKLISQLNRVPFLTGNWELLEFTADGNGIMRLPHKLNYKPKDVIIIHQNGVGSIQWKYDLFSKKEVIADISGISGSLNIRALIGEVR